MSPMSSATRSSERRACTSTTDLVPHASDHDALPLFSAAMLRFVSPLSLPGLALSLVLASRDRRRRVS